jgi:eukaryotic-like serine/threonine-protein kinase
MIDPPRPTKDHPLGKSESQSDNTASFTSDPDATRPANSPFQAASSATEPKTIGPYLLIQKLGQGGMGQVWLAEQTAPVRRQVAVKLIKAGLYDDSVLQRFLSERQSLAIMDHPSIAKVFDAGATVDGQPYLVMEYVPGTPITRYCDEHHLKIQDRLELFIKVCDGVQHAHQKAIIHRDLKPANILVVEVDGQPTPRIIDFGLAKALTLPSADETMFTQAGGLVGTPAYMSPEQSDPVVRDIDTRVDVYSLGVVLYELLTGSLPIDLKQLRNQPLYEVVRQLREQDAPRPSTKVQAEKKSGTAAAEMRGTGSKHLARLLHGDLDWIAMKAIEKERERRYGTPSELAADVGRHLRHEPVLARPASAGYWLRTYVRRHRVAVAVVAGLVLLLAGFSVVQGLQLRRITQERDRATRERDRATRITDFMTGMFQVSDPSQARGNNVTAREILDKASTEIDPGLSKDPELQAQMMFTMGNVYERLGLYSQSQSLLTRALEIQRRVLGAEHPSTLGTMQSLSDIYLHQGRYAEAETMLRDTLDTRRRILGPDHPDTLKSMNDLGLVLTAEGRFADAEKVLRDALEIKTRVLGPEDSATLNSVENLGNVFEATGHHADAERLYREALDIRRRVQGPDAPDTLKAMNNLGNILDNEGHHVEAEKLLRDALEIETRILGPEHPVTLMSMHNLGDILFEEGRYADAEEMMRDTLNVSRRVMGPENPDTAASIYSLGSIALRTGKRDEALADLGQAVDHGLPPNMDLGIETDPDLKSLHGDARFAALVAHAKERAAAKQKTKSSP